MRNYQDKDVNAKMVRALRAAGAQVGRSPFSGDPNAVTVPKTATLSVRLWGFIDYLRTFDGVTLKRS